MPDNPRSALQAGRDRLYHYEKFRPEWLTTTLRDHKIYLTDPARLNDPWDLKPAYDPKCMQTPEEIEELILWLRTIAKQRPEPRVEAKFENRLRTDCTYRENIITEFTNSNCAMLGSRKIYCLTPNPSSSLMWSHYGDSHRGICLEFLLDNAIFRNAWEVTYAETYPK